MSGVAWTAMSVGQRGLWFEQQADPESNAYNLAACVRFREAIDPVRLDAAVRALGERHPLMRARFGMHEGEPSWHAAEDPLQLVCFDAMPEEQAKAAIAGCLLRPYELGAQAPYRFAYAPTTGDATLLAIGCHHIVSDLHSVALVLRDLDAAYTAATPEMEAGEGYEAFVTQQRSLLESEEGAATA